MEFIDEVATYHETTLSQYTKETAPRKWEELFTELQPLIDEISEPIATSALKKPIYPEIQNVFNAFYLCSPQNLKVVILGQDPYHQPGQAMGLSFSVYPGIKVPPSLVNIYKELEQEGFLVDFANGDLTKWAKQGVLLLNSALTVPESSANAHAKLWQKTTKRIVEYLDENFTGIVWLLWGRNAHKLGSNVDENKHHLLLCCHPSPLAANKGNWFGNNHFNITNNLLKEMGKTEIDWNLIN